MLTDSEIRARRAVEKLTQKEFAKKLGISREELSRIELGKTHHVSAAVEAKYDAIYNGKRLIQITFYRGVDCPVCGAPDFFDESFVEPKNVYHDGDNLENDTYKCQKCGRVFTAREAWAKANKERSR